VATFTSKAPIDELIANNGHYMDDPQVHSIVEFEIADGQTHWAVCWLPVEEVEAFCSPFVYNPRIIFRATP
jgi:hypothetical protein